MAIANDLDGAAKDGHRALLRAGLKDRLAVRHFVAQHGRLLKPMRKRLFAVDILAVAQRSSADNACQWSGVETTTASMSGRAHNPAKSTSAARPGVRSGFLLLGVMAFDVRLGRLAAVGGALFPGIVAIVKRLDIADGNHLNVGQPEKLPQIVESLPSPGRSSPP